VPSRRDIHDTHALAFRVRMLRTGLWPSLFTSGYCFVYFGLTWGQPHRVVLIGLSALTTAGSLAVSRAPIERLFGGRWCEPFFLAWSASVIIAIAGGVALDGGVTSPLTPLFFLPLVYAALSYPTRSMLAVGVMTVAAYLGVAFVMSGVSEATALIKACALFTATWICAWQARNHAQQRTALNEVSRTDPLTGSLNRRGFAERFAAELADSARHGRPLGLILIDLDQFKAVNDTHGHAAGDELLCWVAATLLRTARPHDTIGRLGGDEFGVLLPGTGADAPLIMRRLLGALEERTAASAGSSTFPLNGADEMELHHAADADLYTNKIAGPAKSGGDLNWAAALAQIVDRRMASPHEHSKRVAEYAAAIATRLGWAPNDIDRVRMAAMLHDVGKAEVAESILQNPGALSEDEFAEMSKHPAAGATIIAGVGGLDSIVPWIRHSHERIDGSGYPDGLTGEAIPLASRILLVADAYDAMTSDRAYRTRLGDHQAIEELRRNSGNQFDARCADALIAHLTYSAAPDNVGARTS
jgi:diguanylate cyclase (GGDEF)-like protein/putative nucleotidyltransferase with HDIG domain